MITTDTEFWWLIGIFAGLILVVLIICFGQLLDDFSRELRRLNNEIKGAEGTARERWVRKRRRLWLSLLPFVKY